jgi:hypothetical protein
MTDFTDMIIQLQHLRDGIAQSKRLLRLQGRPGTWDYDDYMCGMYNGMELMISTIESREPKFKTLKQGEHTEKK